MANCRHAETMKILLLKTATGLYLEGLNKWTNNPDEALDFKVISRAIKFIEIWKLQGTELTFGLDDLSINPSEYFPNAIFVQRATD